MSYTGYPNTPPMFNGSPQINQHVQPSPAFVPPPAAHMTAPPQNILSQDGANYPVQSASGHPHQAQINGRNYPYQAPSPLSPYNLPPGAVPQHPFGYTPYPTNYHHLPENPQYASPGPPTEAPHTPQMNVPYGVFSPQMSVAAPYKMYHQPAFMNPQYLDLMTQAILNDTYGSGDEDDGEEDTDSEDELEEKNLTEQIQILTEEIETLKQEKEEKFENLIPKTTIKMTDAEENKCEHAYHNTISELQRMFLELEGSHTEQFEALDLISQLVFYFKGSIKPKYVCVSTRSEEEENRVDISTATTGSKYVLHSTTITGDIEFNSVANVAAMKNMEYQQGPTTFGKNNQEMQKITRDMVPEFKGRSIPTPSQDLIPPSQEVKYKNISVFPQRTSPGGPTRDVIPNTVVPKAHNADEESDSDTLSSRGESELDHPLVSFTDIRDIAINKIKNVLYRMDMPVIDMFRLFCGPDGSTVSSQSMSAFMCKSGVPISKNDASKVIQTYDRNHTNFLHAIEFQELVGSLLGDSHLFKLNTKHLSKVKFEGFSTTEKYLLKMIVDNLEAEKKPPSKIYRDLLIHSKNDFLWSEAFCQALRKEYDLQFDDQDVKNICNKFHPGGNGLSKSAFTRMISTTHAF